MFTRFPAEELPASHKANGALDGEGRPLGLGVDDDLGADEKVPQSW